MKVFYFILMLFVSASMYGQGSKKYSKADLEAIKTAYNIMKVAYYPSIELCVADSIYNHVEWIGFSVDNETKQKLESAYFEAVNHVDYAPVYSKQLYLIFGSESCCKGELVAEFSRPYKNMIMCKILPKDRKIGLGGVQNITVFLFQYNAEGEIEHIDRGIAHID